MRPFLELLSRTRMRLRSPHDINRVSSCGDHHPESCLIVRSPVCVPQCSTRHFDLFLATSDFNASRYEKKPQETGDSASGTTFASKLSKLLMARGRIVVRSRWSPAKCRANNTIKEQNHVRVSTYHSGLDGCRWLLVAVPLVGRRLGRRDSDFHRRQD